MPSPLLDENAMMAASKQTVAGFDYSAPTLEGVSELLSRLIALNRGVRSYAFTWAMTELVNKHGHEVCDLLCELLKEGAPRGFGEPGERDAAFAAYYAMSIYYKRYSKLMELGDLISCYMSVFADYPLGSEVLSRYYKRVGDLRRALDCDRDAIARLAPVINYGVLVSYSSTVSMMMEKELPVTEEESAEASRHIEEAIAHNNRYPSYYHIAGKLKLLMIRLDPNDADSPIELNNINARIDDAVADFKKAIEFENEKDQDYYKRVYEHQAYINKAESMRIEAQMLFRINEMNRVYRESTEKLAEMSKSFDENRHELDEKLTQSSREVESKLSENQHKMLELLALFTAIVQIVMVSIGFISKEYSLFESVIHIVVLNVCTLSVYSTLLLIKGGEFKKAGLKPLIALIVCLAILAFIIFGICLPTGLTLFA